MPRAAVKERPARSDTKEQESTCQHHWYIATPAGSTSRGVCRRCGEERDFRNSTSDYVWDDDSRGGSPWRGTRPSKTTADDPDQISATGASSKAVVS
jgi:hypothetical protein